MNEILGQLGLNQTYFAHFIIFVVLFMALSQIYFKPFLKLIQERHRKTVEDREAAQKMIEEAEAKITEYQKRIHEERLAARGELDRILKAAKQEENEILSQAREEAKKVTQETAEALAKQKTELKKQLGEDVENLARTVSEQLLSKRV